MLSYHISDLYEVLRLAGILEFRQELTGGDETVEQGLLDQVFHGFQISPRDPRSTLTQEKEYTWPKSRFLKV